MNRTATTLAAALLAATLLSGCAATYVAPGRGAPMVALGMSPQERERLTDGSIQQRLDKRPLAQFPTAIAVARVQAPGYRSYTAHGWGRGDYSVVTTRDVETEAHFAKLRAMPMVSGVAPLNRLVLPPELHSDRELRHAAASLQADMLLIYTLDTVFEKDNFAEPLTLVSLGLAPNQRARVRTTASAVLMDTRNGYVYGLAEATADDKALTNAWNSREAADASRRATEAEAFDKLVNDFVRAWPSVVARYAPATAR